ncbi:CAP domain-containing protein [Nocardioides sp. SOB77]|uniref:CAP domain-containing protein n=1 Tax=Nocardioides oceani TaxID=3058369 RepID=A0ABT8F9J3_9ACTN|nr:CAP domain-containing protein [Nocardioides oceani]MDN4171364.1 CAP domain-containing protein [Nocardioides oceani]
MHRTKQQTTGRTTQRTVLGAATTALGVALTVAGPAAPSAAATTTGAAGYAGDARVATNAQRADHGRARVGSDGCLQRMAARQADRMARAGRMWHQDLQRVLRDCDMRLVGENVAQGYASGRATVDRGWMRSAGHRRNILDPDFRAMGLAARQGEGGRWYVAQVLGAR